MTEYFLHTGMHKTGTKFFQHKAFPNLDSREIVYNPPKLCQLICDLLKADSSDVDMVIEKIVEEKIYLENKNVKKVLISREIMSGNLFNFYSGYESHYLRLSRAFPQAKIIIAIRYQVDWIISVYRESIHEHHYQDIGEFLGFLPGNDKFIKADYKDLDYSGIITCIQSLFGVSNVHLFFYENFRVDKQKTLQEIANFLGIRKIDITYDGDSIPNRGYSALAIKISIYRYKFLKAIRMENKFVHRPIKFFGEDSIPAGFEELSILSKKKYWHDGFLRDNEEVRKPGYPNNLTKLDQVKLRFSWRFFIKQVFDKIVYIDKDLLSNKRSALNEHFKRENTKLLNIVQDCQVPKKYYE